MYNETWYVTFTKLSSRTILRKLLRAIFLRWKINEIKADVGRKFRRKKLCKLKLFHYNYYSIQRFNVFLFLLKPHHIRYFPHIRKMVLSFFTRERKLSHEFFLWNRFSWIFELSFTLAREDASKYTFFHFFFFLSLLLKKMKEALFCFMWRLNNRWEKLNKKFNLYGNGVKGGKKNFEPTAWRLNRGHKGLKGNFSEGI